MEKNDCSCYGRYWVGYRTPHRPTPAPGSRTCSTVVATGVYAKTCISTRGYEDVNPILLALLTPIAAQPAERTREAPETGDMKLGRRKPTGAQSVQQLCQALKPGHSGKAENLSGGDWPIRSLLRFAIAPYS
jgi:hypothetical protein